MVSGGGLVVFSVLLLGAEQHIAQGISLVAQIPPTSLTGIERYWEGGSRSPLRWLVVLAVGLVAGGVAGAYGASHASSSVLQWSYVAYLLGLDALLVARGARKAAEKDETVATTDLHWAALLTVGSIAGQSWSWAALVGVILGLLIGTDLGARLAHKIDRSTLHVMMVFLVSLMAAYMSYKALT